MTEWYIPFITMDISPLEKVVRTIVVYLAIVILVRIAGKRLIAQMNALDFIVILLLSNVVQNAIIGPDNSVLGALVGAVVLVVFDLALDWVSDRFPAAGRVLNGVETEVIRDGQPSRSALRRIGIDPQELDRALRRQGIFDVKHVKRATLAPEGGLLVDPMPTAPPATRADLAAAVAELKALIQAQHS